ncbi:antibiotic biosynthesis monooxygenase [Lentibacter algarum]|uniref:putative quinol monooxygenase n=1 Tax=Lentibacter algarum TaxID=576131 RepID=UPI001C08FD6A|nr:antibiotic biosynthesis monooxygenase [Lentibacter algarum]MBU2982825.1 antibiotic biosynthesis monooxygenase [Lentibacter algarum]
MLTRILTFDVKPEHTEGFRAAFLEAKAGTENEAGFEEARLFVDNGNPNRFFAYERLQEDAQEFHKAQPYTKNLMAFVEKSQTAVTIRNVSDTKPAPDHSKSPNADDEVFVIFFIFKLKPEYREQLLAQFETHITHTKNEPGNILFDLYTVDGADDELVVYEHWRKESDVWDIHFHQPYAEETGALMEQAVVGDMKQYMNFVTEVV